MSFVIASNKPGDVNEYERSCQDQSAQRFRNHLTYPIEIEPDSEVAVQSVKVNKNGLIKIDRDMRWAQFFGRNLYTNTEFDTVDETLSWPIMCGADMFDDDTPDYVSLQEFTRRMTFGMRQGFLHPDKDATNTKCDILTDSGTSGQGFKGFQLQYQYDPVATAGNLPNSIQWATRPGANLTFTDETGGTRIASTSDELPNPLNQNVAIANQYPLSRQDGVLEYDATLLQDDHASGDEEYIGDFMLGLCRAPYDRTDLNLPYSNHVQDEVSLNKVDFDYVLSCERDESGIRRLYLGHRVVDPLTDTGGKGGMVMREIYYYKDTTRDDYDGGDFWNNTASQGYIGTANQPYNMTANHLGLSHFKFEVQNEKVIISAMSINGGTEPTTGATLRAGDYVVLSSFDYATAGSGADKDNYVKPSGQTTWKLYPKVVLSQTGKSVDVLDTYTGKDVGHSLLNTLEDWTLRMWDNGQGQNVVDVDSRYMYQMSGNFFNTQYTPLGTAGSGGPHMVAESYENIVIVSPDNRYVPSRLCNAGSRLGFQNRSVLDSSVASLVDDQKTQYKSDSIPELSYSSMFVRLDNFTQRSYNSGTGRPSKILYHVPRFDTSNRDLGISLFYEPSERTYVKLHNKEILKLNELNISFCDNEERLVYDLSGQSVVCLHFRKSLN